MQRRELPEQLPRRASSCTATIFTATNVSVGACSARLTAQHLDQLLSTMRSDGAMEVTEEGIGPSTIDAPRPVPPSCMVLIANPRQSINVPPSEKSTTLARVPRVPIHGRGSICKLPATRRPRASASGLSAAGGVRGHARLDVVLAALPRLLAVPRPDGPSLDALASSLLPPRACLTSLVFQASTKEAAPRRAGPYQGLVRPGAGLLHNPTNWSSRSHWLQFFGAALRASSSSESRGVPRETHLALGPRHPENAPVEVASRRPAASRATWNKNSKLRCPAATAPRPRAATD